jgi:hypothetical protein
VLQGSFFRKDAIPFNASLVRGFPVRAEPIFQPIDPQSFRIKKEESVKIQSDVVGQLRQSSFRNSDRLFPNWKENAPTHFKSAGSALRRS